MSVQVVSVCNRIPDRAREPYYNFPAFVASMARFGEAPTILGMGEPWGGLMTKPRRLRQWLRAGGCTAETLIVSDSFDIVFTVAALEVEAAYRSAWPEAPVVFNAERGIFPRGELAHKFEAGPVRTSPWIYLNSGFMIGPPATILAMLEAMWLDDITDDYRAADALHGGAGRMIEPNDQGHYQYAYCAQVVPMALDYEARLCQCLSACTLEEFDLTQDFIQNAVTESTPLVFHFNGGSKNDLLPVFLKKWGLD
jgi:hypothetical protein